jgi:hypothetical protein
MVLGNLIYLEKYEGAEAGAWTRQPRSSTIKTSLPIHLPNLLALGGSNGLVLIIPLMQ